MDPKNNRAGSDVPPPDTNSPSNQNNPPEINSSEIACNIETRLTESRYAALSNISSSIIPSIRWCPTSEHDLEQAESGLLAGEWTYYS